MTFPAEPTRDDLPGRPKSREAAMNQIYADLNDIDADGVLPLMLKSWSTTRTAASSSGGLSDSAGPAHKS